MPQAAQTRRSAVGQTRAGRGGGTHRRDLRQPKGAEGLASLASSSSTCMVNSPIRFMRAIQFRLHRIALALLERGVDPADRFLTPLLEPEDLYAHSGATSGCAPARSRGKPQGTTSRLRAIRSIAGHSPSYMPSRASHWPGGKRRTQVQARPHLLTGPCNEQGLSDGKMYRSCSGPPGHFD